MVKFKRLKKIKQADIVFQAVSVLFLIVRYNFSPLLPLADFGDLWLYCIVGIVA